MTKDMKQRLARAGVALAFSLGVLAVFGWIHYESAEESDPIGFQAAGFLVLRPATAHHVPGTFNTVENRQSGSVVLHPTCNINPDDFSEAIIKTKTLNGTIKRRLDLGYEVARDSWKDLKLGLKLDTVRAIRVSFTNSRIWMLTAESVYSIRDRYLQGSCQDTVVRELTKGVEVCQTKSVVVSDVVYKVSHDSSVAAGIEIFNADGMATAVREVSGERIFHAVKLDRPCILINTPSKDVAEGSQSGQG